MNRTAAEWYERLTELDTKFEMAGVTAPPFASDEVEQTIAELDLFYLTLAGLRGTPEAVAFDNLLPAADEVMEKYQGISSEEEFVDEDDEPVLVEESENEDGDEIIVEDE